jgi:hypothetical protein
VAYRQDEDRLGNAAREDDAVVAFGAWRSRVRTIVLTICTLTGAVLGIPGFLLVRELQFQMIGVALYYVSAIGFVIPFLVLAGVGVVVGRRVVRSRTPGAIDRIAAEYQIDKKVLVETAAAVDEL